MERKKECGESRNFYLSIIEMTESSNFLLFVEIIASDFESSHGGEQFEILHKFLARGLCFSWKLLTFKQMRIIATLILKVY